MRKIFLLGLVQNFCSKLNLHFTLPDTLLLAFGTDKDAFESTVGIKPVD